MRSPGSAAAIPASLMCTGNDRATGPCIPNVEVGLLSDAVVEISSLLHRSMELLENDEGQMKELLHRATSLLDQMMAELSWHHLQLSQGAEADEIDGGSGTLRR